MIDFRLACTCKFLSDCLCQTWGADLSMLDPNDIHYYVKPIEEQHTILGMQVPQIIKTTFEKLGIPQAEQKFLAGVGAQYESEVVYKRLQKKWADQGVVFSDMSTALARKS